MNSEICQPMRDITQCLTVEPTMVEHQQKGGEKTKSEWEELESLSKDELIIELVRARTLYRYLREDQDESCPLPPAKTVWSKDSDDDRTMGEKTTHDWAVKIAKYGAMHPRDGAFFSCDLVDYGLTEEQAAKICDELMENGDLKLPDGIEYEPRGGDVE